ncbi:hypothetical protein ACT3TS_04905 [Specibacter sp. AOP5-B1-6]
MGTQTNDKTSAPVQEEDRGGLASNLIGIWTVGGGIICFALLIWFGL